MTAGRRTGLHAVAERAGVSVSLVSRILSGDDAVRARPETRERVRAAARELGYQPHGAARALRLARAGALGLVVHDMSNPIHAEIIRGAQAAATDRGQVLLLSDATQLAGNDDAFAQLLGPGRIDGLMWQGSGEEYDDELAARAAGRLPTLLVNSRSRAGVPALRLDDERAARLAVRHLVELGHRDVAYLGGRPGADLTERRRAGYAAELAAHDLAERPQWTVELEWDAPAGYAGMTRLLAAEPRPTAVFVANVVVAVGALAAAREAGVRVPADLSVVAVHDAWFVAHGAPPLTTVRLPLHRLGDMAVSMLLDGDQARAADGLVIDDPAPELLVRGSTAARP
ncbi:LacI family DNA-binding transcriptional regulator [Actinocatenispora rupis]|uniref:LacI family transcriptional regulator n=1 Tax=Actinocatenispora rupis TaxID=519421 RepID=A0A8J3NED7_9ACTN|nr:LacI family DNA-binding transcriptional regulator [Actinocatenispora rupis]GID16249.1 LacI family transcriptional regulator [Actinocatenispora rupis]